MSPSAQPNATPDREIQVPMPAIVKFLRQLGHDLRNQLNAAELQAAYLTEIVQNPELADELKRLRKMISETGASLERLTSSISAIKLTTLPYDASDFVDDLRQRLAANHPNENEKIEWLVQLNNASLEIDPLLLQVALLELFTNAFRHERTQDPIRVEAQLEQGHFVFRIREPKAKFERPTDKWGLEPLQAIGRGHYGLGLHRSRAIIEAHRGHLNADYDSQAAALITTVSLPLTESAG